MRGQQRGKQRRFGRCGRLGVALAHAAHYTGFMARKTTPNKASKKPAKRSPASRNRGPRPRSRRPSAASGRPAPRRRPSCSTSIRSRCWSRWCCPRRRPTPASTRRRPRCSPLADTPEKMAALGEDRCATASRPSGSIATRRRTSSRCRAAWSPSTAAGAARPRGAGGAARRRTQDRECRAQRRVRRADHRGRHAYLPRRQPHQHGAGQGPRSRSS